MLITSSKGFIQHYLQNVYTFFEKCGKIVLQKMTRKEKINHEI